MKIIKEISVSLYSRLKLLTDEEILCACDTYKSARAYLVDTYDIHKIPNGRYTSLINTRRRELNLEWVRVKPLIKECPVCSKEFSTSKGDNNTTCSYSCSNTYFRSGINNGMYKAGKSNYRGICFAHHDKACVVCEEDIIVEVHHLDEDHNNNDPENLIPLCPNHHKYWHSKNKHLVEKIVLEYVRNRQRSIV